MFLRLTSRCCGTLGRLDVVRRPFYRYYSLAPGKIDNAFFFGCFGFIVGLLCLTLGAHVGGYTRYLLVSGWISSSTSNGSRTTRPGCLRCQSCHPHRRVMCFKEGHPRRRNRKTPNVEQIRIENSTSARIRIVSVSQSNVNGELETRSGSYYTI